MSLKKSWSQKNAAIPGLTPLPIQSVMEYVEKLAEQFRPERVILFGSLAEGRATPDSDVDLMVVMPSSRNTIDLALDIRRSINRAFPLDLIVRTTSEVRQAFKKNDGFICSIFRHGKVLYEKKRP
jgi:uncharacterized protein